MNSYKLNKVGVIFIFFILFTWQTLVYDKVFAEESQFQDISIEAILPENQIDSKAKYFDLKMSPTDKQQISIKFKNNSSENVKFKTSYNDAKTTSQGIIEYSENNDLKLYSPEKFRFTKIISGPDEVTLNPGETKIVAFNLHMPKDEYDGVVAGGIEFIQEIEKTEQENALKSQRSYLIGVRLRENDTELPIDLDLTKTSIGMKNYKNAILIPLENKNGDYVEDLDVTIKLNKKNESNIFFQVESKKMRVAPHSLLEIPIYLDELILDTGDYEATILAKSGGKFNKEWTQEFEVTKKDLDLYKENQEDWNLRSKKNYVWKIVIIIVITTIIIAITVFLYINIGKKERAKCKKIKK